jgi:hypothetical protein
MNLKPSPLRHRRSIWPWLISLSVCLVAAVHYLPTYRNGGLLLSAVGSLWALAFYLHGRHGEDAKFAKELMTDFNHRYGELNGDLQLAIWHDVAFPPDAELKFIDYFNVCAEEWLFAQTGYIYDFVWHAWRNGIKRYSADPRVVALWLEEKKTNSYYGFDLLDPDKGLR